MSSLKTCDAICTLQNSLPPTAVQGLHSALNAVSAGAGVSATKPPETAAASGGQLQSGLQVRLPEFYPASGPGAVVYQESDFEPWTDVCPLDRDEYNRYKVCLVGRPVPVRPPEPAFSDEALRAAGYASWCAYSAADGVWTW